MHNYRKIIEEKRKELEEALTTQLRCTKVTCKICTKQIVAEKLVVHSTNCREKNELNNKIAGLNDKINSDRFEAYRNLRQLSNKNLLLS